jgi:hypothetical protein
MRTSLILPHKLGLDIFSFSHSMFLLFFCLFFFNIKKNKNGGEDVEFLFFSFDNFSDIVCIFA